MHKIPDRTDMIFDLLRKGQRFAHQATDSLPQRVGQTLDMTGLSAFLADRPVPFRRQDTRRGIPKLAGTYRTTADTWVAATPSVAARLLRHMLRWLPQPFPGCHGHAPATPIPSGPYCQQTTTIHHMRWSIGLLGWIRHAPDAVGRHISRCHTPGAGFPTPGPPVRCRPARCVQATSGQ
jgi:hypothetical protein